MTAVFTTLLLSGATSAYAGIAVPQCGSLFDIDSATVFENSDEVSVKVNLVDCNNLQQFADFGAGALTDGTHVVIASHGGPNGFQDSELQTGPNDPIEHNHLINLGTPQNTQDQNDCFDQNADAIVTSLSFESPGIAEFADTTNDNVDPDMYKIWEVPKILSGTDALTSQPQVFTLGNLGVVPEVVTFSLTLGDDGVCVFVQDSVDAFLEDLARKVGGDFLPIDSTALLIAGMSANMGFIVPIVAGIAGAGAYFVRSRMNKE